MDSPTEKRSQETGKQCLRGCGDSNELEQPAILEVEENTVDQEFPPMPALSLCPPDLQSQLGAGKSSIEYISGTANEEGCGPEHSSLSLWRKESPEELRKMCVEIVAV